MLNPDADVVLTVLDTATIYEATESIFRYDLPGTGVVEGWALAGCVDQAAKLAGPAWPKSTVEVIVDPSSTAVGQEAASIIARHLRMSGVRVLDSPAHDPQPPTEVAPATSADAALADAAPATSPTASSPEQGAWSQSPSPPPSHSPRRREAGKRGWRSGGGTGRRGGIGRSGGTGRGEPQRARTLYLVAGVAVVGIGGLALVALGNRHTPELEAQPAASSSAAAHSSAPKPSELPSVMSLPGRNGGAGEAETVEVEGMRVDLPAGFHWRVDDGLVTLSGQDPNLRILLAADPIYAVPGAAIMAEIRQQVDADAALSGLEDLRTEHGREGLSYVEKPGDDSIVVWSTWVEEGYQLSVGCHSRTQATVAHKAACRIATNSLSKISDAHPAPATPEEKHA
ncbi:type VII secretion-associated protein [Corynebacterium lizhenjunii]|uniref:Type VII secretion-associated protein n=1 Tax=Corynebacterium lizhenjunii TaxID=2709394 RepID=A0A7T0KFI3_9CORY|nr:type VII secretion-associated protein [Corynebacterium lizhenjunii]QPK79589.1 type VII secretion-associated protein [Corynebacterium lizhenjunii]